MTKAQAALFGTYKRATATDLWQVYGRYSRAKAEAMARCRQLQYELGGFDGRICSANSFNFSYAFLYENCDGDICLCYITKEHVRRFFIG